MYRFRVAYVLHSHCISHLTYFCREFANFYQSLIAILDVKKHARFEEVTHLRNDAHLICSSSHGEFQRLLLYVSNDDIMGPRTM